MPSASIAGQSRILVVDDNTVAQTIASHMLKRCGYEVECAYSLFQSSLGGVSELFSVGQFRMHLIETEAGLRIRRQVIITDTHAERVAKAFGDDGEVGYIQLTG